MLIVQCTLLVPLLAYSAFAEDEIAWSSIVREEEGRLDGDAAESSYTHQRVVAAASSQEGLGASVSGGCEGEFKEPVEKLKRGGFRWAKRCVKIRNNMMEFVDPKNPAYRSDQRIDLKNCFLNEVLIHREGIPDDRILIVATTAYRAMTAFEEIELRTKTDEAYRGLKTIFSACEQTEGKLFEFLRTKRAEQIGEGRESVASITGHGETARVVKKLKDDHAAESYLKETLSAKFLAEEVPQVYAELKASNESTNIVVFEAGWMDLKP